MSAGNSAKFGIVLHLVSFLLVGLVLSKRQQASGHVQQPVRYQIILKVQEAEA